MLSALATVYLDCNHPEKAKPLLDRLLNLCGSLPPESSRLAGVYYQLARLHRLQGTSADAESLCKRVIQLDPNHYDARGMLSEIDKENGISVDDTHVLVDDGMIEALAQRISTLSSTGLEVAIRRFEMIRRKSGAGTLKVSRGI